MKFISLFSGIGGLDLGLERAGWECVAQVEKDEYCRRVLAKHWPDVPRFEDVRNVGRDNLPAADAIVGGFPCQPHSYAGQRKGAADDRNLWPEYLRIIAECRPAWVVGENVPGLATTMLDDIISDLEGADYAVQTFDIPAIAFDARHIRHRLFIVAYANAVGRDGRAGEFGPGWRRELANCRQWEPESNVGRVAHGISRRVDRLRGLGNAVVPQVAEFVGRMILESGL